MITVKWDQWFRCGRYGDDKDFESMSMVFESRELADEFVSDLVSGKNRGRGDCTVHREEVKIIE